MIATGRRVMIDCDGAAANADVAGTAWADRREICSVGPDADLVLDLAAFGGAILKRLGSRTIDLLRVAAYVFRADQLISRGGGRDAHASRWRRHLTLYVPVTDPDFWSTVQEHLSFALRFLTDDVWEFAFAEAAPDLRQTPLGVPSEEVIGQPTSVVPISGGIDSLCVLLETAAAGGRPLAVSHWSTETHKARQLNLLAQVRQRFRHWDFPLLGLSLHGVGDDPPDASQRSRGFLYAALATAAAGELGMTKVLFGDNGPISINLPINDQLVGALASRATHPTFLSRFNQFARELYPVPVTATNPLRARTRAETLEVLKTARCVDLLPMTLSCSKWRGLPAATPQCGTCSQCVDRRFATIAAGVEEHDPAARYRHDVFVDDLTQWEAVTTAQSYVRFAQRIFPMSDLDVVEAFPQVYDLPTPDDPDPEATIRDAVELVKRHAASTLGVLKTMISRYTDHLVAGSLPAGCLLRMAIGAPETAMTSGQANEPDVVLAQSAAPQASATGAVRENVFAFEGHLWTLRYAGITKYMPHRVGLTRLAVLLREPTREFDPETLLLAAAGTAGATMNQAEAERDHLWPEAYAGGGTIFDQTTYGVLKAEHVLRLRELDAARDADDFEEVERLGELIRQIVREMKAGTGLGGALKPFVDNRTRQRDAVYQSLHRIISEVRTSHPELGAHLLHSVGLRAPYSYAPEGIVTWHVVLPQRKG